MNARDIGSKIKERRLHLKLSQEELAQRFGVHRVTMSQYERGEREIGSTDMPRLARMLGVTVGYFYEDMPDEKTSEEIIYEPVLDELQAASYSGNLESDDVDDFVEYIKMRARMKARRRAEGQGRA